MKPIVPTDFKFMLYFLIAVLILPSTILEASTRQNAFNITFNKGLDNDALNSQLYFSTTFANSGLMICEEKINFQVHQVPGYSRQWKVDQVFNFKYEQPINNRIDWMTVGSLKRYYDLGSNRNANITIIKPEFPIQHEIFKSNGKSNTASSITDISTYYITQGVKYGQKDIYNVSGAIGPLFDSRKDVNDNGYHLEFDLSRDLDGGSLTANGWFERLKAGSEHGLFGDLSGKYKFIGGGQDRYKVFFKRNEHAEYGLVSGSRGYRRDENFSLTNHLVSDEDASFQVSWDSNLSNQVISHTGLPLEYKDREFAWQNEIGTNLMLSGFITGFIAGIDIQEQRYNEAVAQGRRNYFSLESTTAETFLDSATINARIIKYRYDTPDINDSNDRDELRYLISLNGAKKLTSELGFRFRIETNLHHLVYIYSMRSAENRWTRVFSLSCELPWQRGSFSNNCRFAIVSTYTVYDFPESDSDLSRVYRFFSAEDTLSIDLSNSFRLECRSALLLDEHGRFRWAEWKEDVSEDGYSLSASLIPVYHNGDVILGAGWETHHRYSWQHQADGSKVGRESVISYGPVMYIKSNPTTRLVVEMSSSVLHVKDRFRGSYNLPEITCSLTWTF